MPDSEASILEVAASTAFDVRELVATHHAAAAKLIRSLIIPEFEVADLIAELRFSPLSGLVAVSGENTVLGVSCLRLPDLRYDVDLDSAQLQYLAVARSRQRRYGIGGTLLAHCEQKARESDMHELWLWAIPQAEPFYAKHGYTRILTTDPKSHGAVPMTKPLT